MRKRILDALKAKFVGVSDAILGRIADKLSKTVTTEEAVTAAVEGVTIQQVIESYGDSRATEAQQTAVHNYESKYGLKDGAKQDGSNSDLEQSGADTEKHKTAGGDEIPAWAKTLLDTNKALSDRLTSFEKERTTATRKQQISEIIGKLPDTLRKPYERMAYDSLSDEDFSGLITDVTAEVNGIVSANQAKGAVFGRPAAKGGKINQGGELSKEQEEAISRRESAPKEGQPF
jgi:hypothetical protein